MEKINIDPELLKLGKELVQLEDDYDPYASVYDEKYTIKTFKDGLKQYDDYIDILIKYCSNLVRDIDESAPEFKKRYRDLAKKFRAYKLNKKKTEGVQDQRLANSIKWLKDSGYEEYKTGDKYTLLVNKTKYDGEVVAAMFYGKSAKPVWHYRFRSMDELNQYTDKYLQRKADQEEVDRQWKEKRKLTKDHNIKVGDIFDDIWGYDQTNIDYYEVVAVRGSRIDLRPLKKQYIDNEGQEDIVIPAEGENRFSSDEIFTVSARADGTVTSIDSVRSPSKWDGKPNRETNSMFGH